VRKLIQGIVDFRKNLTKESRALFATLALGQKPDALFICCSDSRVAPNVFASTNPGDLFVLRNMGNLVPSPEIDQEFSIQAAIEFSMLSLKVSNIIICGHSECGAMIALSEGVNQETYPHLHSWLKMGEKSLEKMKSGFTLDPALSKHNQLSQINVLQQMEHISSYAVVQERVNKGEVRVHGWWFDIANADVYCYERSVNQFVLIEEIEAQLILDRLL
jgi:carbonic anhydrase